jgi:asparagine synthase (glutamine-hydrolysing)
MCGIVGIYTKDWMACQGQIIQQMTNTLAHRGPDDEGVWLDKDSGIAFGHRRLAIQDLSKEGHQPMESICGRYIIVFNGEVYNYKKLRKEIDSNCQTFEWRGQSDTEVMLASITLWGLEKAVQKLQGMFAFALWDRKARTLQLVRDRIGEKPLYYGWLGNTFLFGSELKAFQVYPSWNGKIDRGALKQFLRYNYVPTPHCIYQDFHKLLPGSILTLDSPEKREIPLRYWSLSEVARKGIKYPYKGSIADCVRSIDDVLRSSIEHQMIADVPIGAFLSGGIDSSTVVALMQSLSNCPIKTYTIGFDYSRYNEAKEAKIIAQHLGTEHTELYISSDDAHNVIPDLPFLYDEPFADSSQIPTFLVAKLAKHDVTVVLSGDGGDELFGGYNRHIYGPHLWSSMNHCPVLFRKILAKILLNLSPQQWDSLFGKRFISLFFRKTPALIGEKIHKTAICLPSLNVKDFYLSIISQWQNPENVVLNDSGRNTDELRMPLLKNVMENFLLFDGLSYLPDDILTKVDRASMGIGLEARVPFLNHDVIDLAWQIPAKWKVRNGQGKWILRKVLYQYLPENLFNRPKMGFSIPIDNWLRGPLKEWADELLNEKRLINEGFFNPASIRTIWEEHLSGKFNWQYKLWGVLMFQAWYENNEMNSKI